jgi:FkbM family methyltransferase
MSITLTSASTERAASPAVDGPAPAAKARSPWAVWAAGLVGRAALDAARLVRSRHTRGKKGRLLLEYVRLTFKLLLAADPSGARPERVLGYRVRHFGYESLQFLFREIFIRNDYFFEAAHERPIIVDGGANIGMATLFFKWMYPRCEVHAFEPDPATFAALRENVEQNALADVHLHNVALCDRNGAVDFFVPGGRAGSLMMSLVAGRVPSAETRRVVVQGRTLSTYLEGCEVDFMKMDIEGGEQAVLAELGRAGALRRVKEMVVEYHHNLPGRPGGLGAFLQLLQDGGYEYEVDATRSSEPSTVPQDILVWARRTPACEAVVSPRSGDGTP